MNKEKLLNGVKFFFKSGMWLIIFLFILDIISKNVMVNILQEEGNAITIIPNFFRLALVYNRGAVAGILKDTGVLLPIISLVGGAIMIYCLWYYYKRLSVLGRYAFFLMIPGCFGNLIDRALYNNRGVIDFLEFKFGNFYWPTFNLADSFLVVGVGMLLVSFFLEERKNKTIAPSEEESDND